MRDILIEIWSSLRRNKLRTALTGFAVAWGIFMLIVLLGAGNGLINGSTENASTFLNNSMEVYGGATSLPYAGFKEGRVVNLDNGDIKTTESSLFSENVDDITASVSLSAMTVTYGEQYRSLSLAGVLPKAQKVENIRMVAGRFINQSDLSEKRKTLVIGENLVEELSEDKETPSQFIGKMLKAGNLMFKVVGVYKADESMMGYDAYIPFTTAQLLSAKGDEVDNLHFTFHGLNTIEANDEFEERYRQEINRNHDVDPADPSAIWLFNRFAANIQMSQSMAILKVALWIIGILTLLSGIVGVSNIMLITVKERKHEFGIRKAIGAKPKSILRLVVTESLVITGFFGYVGMLLGMLACDVMGRTLGNETIDIGVGSMKVFSNPSVGMDVAIGATVLLIVAGIIAGIAPAWKASKIRPIEALRAD